MMGHLLKKLSTFAAVALLASCSSSPVTPTSPQVSASQPSSAPYARPSQDGAPWWDVDVSNIPDAVPTPHTGAFKANPYTVLGQTYYPMQNSYTYNAVGTASWYGTKFHGQATANGESYDLYGMTAAHKTLPLPSYVRVTNLDNNKTVVLRVNDRGPFYSDRIIDLSFAAAKKLGYAESGTARVRVEGIDPHRWLAENGQTVAHVAPMQAPLSVNTQTVEQYSPPLTQHAAAVLPNQISSVPQVAMPASGLYLQVAAFANPDAAELLKAKLNASTDTPAFISSVMRNQQILHRVRIGPIDSADKANQLQNTLRLANLGQATLVRPD